LFELAGSDYEALHYWSERHARAQLNRPEAIIKDGPMIEGVKIYPLDIKRDERGWLAEVLCARDNLPNETLSQLYVTVAYPRKIKGKHYHQRKVVGNAKIYLYSLVK
jgi:dTDP-4-dehydrorhamnose 3,5-epimerase-like enzyme